MTTTLAYRLVERADSEANADDRSIGLTLATETPVRVFDYARNAIVNESLSMAGASFPESLPMLDSHNRETVERVIGSIRDLRVQGSKLIGRAYFASTPAGQNAFSLSQEGHLRDCSVGFRIDKMQFIESGSTFEHGGKAWRGPLRLITKWRAHEGSLCAIGADENAKLSAKARAYFDTDALAAERSSDHEAAAAFVIRLDGAEIPIPGGLSKDDQLRFVDSLAGTFERKFHEHVGKLMTNARNSADVESAGEFQRSIPARLTALQIGCNAAREFLELGFVTTAPH